MLARMSVVLLLLGSALPASAQVLADSQGDFSGVQGANGWRFGYYSGDMTPASFQEMTVFQNNRWYVEPGTYWTMLGAVGAHPNGTVTSPPAIPVDQWAARRWVSDVESQISIDTSIRKLAASDASNGVIGRIFIDGEEVWSQFIPGNDNVGVTAHVNATISVGSTVDFVLDSSGSDDGGDATRFTGVISVVPTPGSLALLGLAGILAFRRKRH